MSISNNSQKDDKDEPEAPKRDQDTAGIVVAMILFFIVSILLVGVTPEYQAPPVSQRSGKPTAFTISPVRRFLIVNEARKTNTQIVGGFFFLLTVYFSWRTVKAAERSAEAAASGLESTREKLEQDKRVSDETLRVAEANLKATEAKLAQDKEAAQKAAEVAEANLKATEAKQEQDSILAKKTLEISEANLRAANERMATERLTKATECLSSDHIITRIGAIQTLERISKQSNEDHKVVVTVLTSFLKFHYPTPPQKPSEEDLRKMGIFENFRSVFKPAQDLTMVMRMIGRRTILPPSITSIGWIELKACDLSGVELTNTSRDYRATYKSVNFANAHLIGVNAAKCDFDYCNFHRTDLRYSLCSDSKFINCKFPKADLRHGIFVNSAFPGTEFTGAELEDADFGGADLSDVVGLTKEQISSAAIDSNTKLPPYL